MTKAPTRVLTLEEIAARTDRYADAWIAGRDIPEDPLLDRSVEEHGFTMGDIIEACARRKP